MSRNLKTVLWLITGLAIAIILYLTVVFNIEMGWNVTQDHIYVDGADAAPLINPIMVIVRLVTAILPIFYFGIPAGLVIGAMWLVAYFVTKGRKNGTV